MYVYMYAHTRVYIYMNVIVVIYAKTTLIIVAVFAGIITFLVDSLQQR